MSLPTDFHFSQGSLQDFADCPRRFQLRYLLQIAWPAVPAEPLLENEHRQRLGQQFHLLLQQHLLQVPLERLQAMAQSDAHLAQWWHAYLTAQPAALPGLHLPEVALSAPLNLPGRENTWRLVAQFDLLVLTNDGRALLFDWKTSQHRPPRRWLQQRLQTRVYPWLLMQAGSEWLSGEALPAERIEMVYWFANFPDRPERLAYSRAQAQADEAWLHGLVERIALLAATTDDFPLTSDENQCRFCVYRSLCQRGVQAGSAAHAGEDDYRDYEADTTLELDFEQITEVAY